MITWQWQSFSDLSAEALYAILKLRQDVFCLEQNCLYPDIDGNDHKYLHLMGWSQQEPNQLVAYLRVAAPGVKYEDASLGRVVTNPLARGSGAGKALMNTAIQYMTKVLGYSHITLSAQRYLESFYKDLGFEIISEPYDEDGIPHVDMRRVNSAQ